MIDIMKTLLDEISETQTPFFLVSQHKISKQIDLWKRLLPEVTPFYAVKCNDHIDVIKIMVDHDMNFDCASIGEIGKIISLGINPKKIIFAHPVKSMEAIKYAKDVGVDLLVIDSLFELEKIKEQFPDARLVMRIQADEEGSKLAFNNKFGVSNKDYESIISKCFLMGLNLVGVSFHVGSRANNSRQYLNSLRSCRQVCQMVKALSSNQKRIEIIDIGGGFPIIKDTFEEFIFVDIAHKIKQEIIAIRSAFGEEIQFIAEPGRYMVGNSHLLFLEIIGKKEEDREEGFRVCYYVDDSVYKSFNCLLYDNANIVPHVIRNVRNDEELYESVIFGESCDGTMDLLVKSIELPDLKIGDRIYFDDMGAYTYSASSNFNGFERPSVIIK